MWIFVFFVRRWMSDEFFVDVVVFIECVWLGTWFRCTKSIKCLVFVLTMNLSVYVCSQSSISKADIVHSINSERKKFDFTLKSAISTMLTESDSSKSDEWFRCLRIFHVKDKQPKQLTLPMITCVQYTLQIYYWLIQYWFAGLTKHFYDSVKSFDW